MKIGSKYASSTPRTSMTHSQDEGPDDSSFADLSEGDSSMSNFDDDMEDDSGDNLRERAAKEAQQNLVKGETRAVSYLRVLVLFVLMATAIGVSVATYFYASGIEKDSFHSEFASVAQTTLRSFVEAVEHTFGSMDAVSTGVTSHAQRSGETFPNVTIPDFEVKGSVARSQNGGIFMFWLPLVTDDTRAGYEAYTAQEQFQIFNSYATEEGLRQYQDAYYGVNASETEAAQARAEAEAAQAERTAESVQEGRASHSHGDEESHSHRNMLRAAREDKAAANQRKMKEVHVTGTEPQQSFRTVLEARQKKLLQELENAKTTNTATSERHLHVAPPDTGAPPYGHPLIHESIWGLNSYNISDNESWLEPLNTGPYLPMWQLSPTIPLPALVNFNFFDYTDLAPALNQSLNTGQAVLSYLQTNHQGADTELLIQVFLTLNQYRHRVVDYNSDPMTQVAYPVFDSFHPTEKKVTGILFTAIFWRLLLLDILPDSVKGVICVLKNSLGQAVTYQVNGPKVEYVGEGDLHDDRYNHLGVTKDISEYIAQRASVESSSYTTVELDVGYTSYEIHVYPSSTMESTYVSNDPILYAIIVAFIFVFTSGVFILYDFCVEKRQKKVMGVAVQSTAVVTSLFPQSVQDRMFSKDNLDNSVQEPVPWMAQSAMAQNASEGNHMRRGGRRASMGANGNDNLLPILDEEFDNDATMGGQSGYLGGPFNMFDQSRVDPTAQKKRRKKKKVIADKYAATTVFFADLAGFTKWSSTREPEQVFELLEALYGAFDKIALRRAVFKVETIGDCYMAVTGLPNPQPDHAIRMVKFARDCMMRMDRILNELQYSLGEDTLELAMRVGCHSGPVTAGVLRGDKGRFQLFGDTVNTASRMESNGVKKRIHVSQSTADLLPAKWLTAREDKIVAKGKGEMQTYFVDTSYEARSSASVFSAFSNITDLTPPAPPQNGDSATVPLTLEAQSQHSTGLCTVTSGSLSNLSLEQDKGDEIKPFENEPPEYYEDDEVESFENEPTETPPKERAPVTRKITVAWSNEFGKLGNRIVQHLNLDDEISV